MDNRLILVTGGARSGKSAFAEQLLTERAGNKAYLATAPVCDAEMAARVARHRERRAAGNWRTYEEECELERALAAAAADGADGLLLDCLTLWLNNLFFAAERAGRELDESGVAARCAELIPTLKRFPGTVVAVLNEVGSGLVPESALSRRFRDASGRCGQLVAAAADEVYWVVCGIPQRIK